MNVEVLLRFILLATPFKYVREPLSSHVWFLKLIVSKNTTNFTTCNHTKFLCGGIVGEELLALMLESKIMS